MLEKIYTNASNNTDINMYKCGIEDCDPEHSWGPAIRDHYLVHFVLSGKGIFRYMDKIYRLEKGQGFLIIPGVIAQYESDSSEPWSYAWIGFNGLMAEKYLTYAGLSCENAVFEYKNEEYVRECFQGMLSTKSLAKSGEIRRLGFLYMILSQLIEESDKAAPQSSEDRKKGYVRKVLEYIQINYSREISVMEISSYIGLDRSYLSSLFRHYMNTSIQKFIIEYRVNKACELMRNAALSLADISRSVGYEDPLLFSKTFRKLKGLPPREYRKRELIT